MFSVFDEIFAPGQKHASDERNRLALSRTDVGDSDPCRGPIDLDSGMVLIRREDAPDPAAEPPPES
ncbi:DUF6191 domain-containing protein [Streptomyces jumonjinensis]|uniref:Uncharacterized protein n=1 Tax=Streptomyces jumonjinensis TaxID=1945 RepID=A0A646KDX7_STRJU|nr:DUF6191 domain-containing protein [Streptomyces jumonjinensis]MQT00445.1 hypothetical protein [Streptomyces jumonjinensis]